MTEFYYNCLINEATTHSRFEEMYEYQPSTPIEWLFRLAGTATNAAEKCTLIANIRDVVNTLLKLSKERMAAKSTTTAPLFQTGDLDLCLSTK